MFPKTLTGAVHGHDVTGGVPVPRAKNPYAMILKM